MQKGVQRNIPLSLQNHRSASHLHHDAVERRSVSGGRISLRKQEPRLMECDGDASREILGVQSQQSGKGFQFPIYAVILCHQYGKVCFLIQIRGPAVRSDAFGARHLQAQGSFCREFLRCLHFPQVGRRHFLPVILRFFRSGPCRKKSGEQRRAQKKRKEPQPRPGGGACHAADLTFFPQVLSFLPDFLYLI